jgi:hypothetical protein
MDICRQISPASLICVCAGYCQRALEDESAVIRTHIRKHNKSVMVAVYGTPCAVPVTVATHQSLLLWKN